MSARRRNHVIKAVTLKARNAAIMDGEITKKASIVWRYNGGSSMAAKIIMRRAWRRNGVCGVA